MLLFVLLRIKPSSFLLWALLASTLVAPCAYSLPLSPLDSSLRSTTAGKTEDNRADAYLRERIFRDLMNDPLVRPDSLSVEVRNSEVVLGGMVDNLFAKLSAERNVRGQLGVGRVNNRLTVTRNPEITDDELSVMVSKALKQNSYVYQFEFKVDVRNGWVSLGGTVRTGFEKNQAIKAVSLVEGVTAVSTNIRVIDKPLLSYQDLLEPSFGDYLEFQSALDSIMLPAGAESTRTISIDVDWLKEGLEPQHPNCFNFLGASIYLIRRFILKDTTLAKRRSTVSNPTVRVSP